jgi:RNA polymerase sigma-70 factor (ECF subfamily)
VKSNGDVFSAKTAHPRSTNDEAPIRGDLCRLATGLARSLRDASPAEPEVAGLLALFLLHEGRRPARLDVSDAPVPLPDQDRARWDRTQLDEGTAELERALAIGRPGPFQTEAAISAVHCRARTADETDWREIAALYALLEGMRPSAAVRVNRAFAVSRVDGPAAGLALLDGEPPIGSVDTYSYARVVRGVLLGELGRRADAVAELEIARAGARNADEAAAIARRIAALR